MADKKLTVALDGKVSPQFARMMKELEQAGNSTAKLNKAQQTLAGTGPAGSGPLAQGAQAKGILAQQKALEALGVTGTKVAKVLNDQVIRAQTALQKSMQVNAAAMGPLMKQLQAAESRLTAPGASPEEVRSASRRRDVIAGILGKRAGFHSDAYGALGDLGGLPPPLPGAGGAPQGGAAGGGFGGLSSGGGIAGRMLMNSAGIPFGGAMMAAGGAIATTALVAAAAVVALKVSQVVMKGNIGFEAARGDIESQRFGLARSFDTRAMAGRQYLAEHPELARDIAGGLTPGGILRGGASGFAAAPQLLSHGLSTTGLLMSLGDFAKSYGTSYGTKTKEAMTEREQELGRAGAALMTIGDEQRAQAPTMRSMMRQYGSGSWKRSAHTATQFGIAPETFQGYMGGVKGSVGAWNAEGYASTVAALEAAGLDPGRALGIVGRNAVGRGGLGLRGTGRLDPTMRAIIGEGVGGAMGIEGAMWKGKGDALSEMLGGGGLSETTGPLGVFQAQQAVGGAAMAGRLYGGHDPYQKSYNIAASSAALGGGADPYQRQALASLMSDPAVLSAVLKGEHPAVLSSMGISKAAAQAYAKDVSASTTTRWMDSGGTYAAAGHMRKAKAAGGIQQYLESIKDPQARERAREELAPLLAQTEEGLTGGTVGGAMQYMRFASGRGATGAVRKGKAAAAGVAEEQDVLDRQKKEMEFVNQTVHQFGLEVVEATAGIKTLKDAHNLAAKGMNLGSQGLKGATQPVPKK